MTQKANVRDVAVRALVSVATVSRVLNGVDSVRPELKGRVLAAVTDLGYRPNRLARSLRRQRAQTVAVMVSDIENPHFAEMVRAAEDRLYDLGYAVLLCNTDERADKQRRYLEVLADERVLGVILAPSNPEDPAITELLDMGIPVVAVDRLVDDPRADAVIGNNLEAGREATAHLIAHGCRHIGFVSGPDAAPTAADRLAGYSDGVRRAGLSSHIAFGGFRIEGGRDATLQLLNKMPLDGLVVANNLMTIGALQAFHRTDSSVPLVTIDDPFWADLVQPPLTALRQPVSRMAATAVELLFERLAGGRREPRRLTFDFQLVVRASCGDHPVEGNPWQK